LGASIRHGENLLSLLNPLRAGASTATAADAKSATASATSTAANIDGGLSAAGAAWKN
jgi:hypothetical protein